MSTKNTIPVSRLRRSSAKFADLPASCADRGTRLVREKAAVMLVIRER
jgi:hypothetical protein